jgi:hypothetical protein
MPWYGVKCGSASCCLDSTHGGVSCFACLSIVEPASEADEGRKRRLLNARDTDGRWCAESGGAVAGSTGLSARIDSCDDTDRVPSGSKSAVSSTGDVLRLGRYFDLGELTKRGSTWRSGSGFD